LGECNHQHEHLEQDRTGWSSLAKACLGAKKRK
jgi:hypothetical protein